MLISVIIPIYNVENYIAQCLDSLIAQTLQDIEIILIDDCSTDNSLRIAEDYALRDPRIKIIRQSRNMGPSAARNIGISQSSAPYIMFCDPDDFVQPEFCEKMFHGVNSYGVDMAVCGTNVILETSCDPLDVEQNIYNDKRDVVLAMDDSVRLNLSVVIWDKIFRRDIIQQYNIRFLDSQLYYGDNIFSKSYFMFAQKVRFIPSKLYNYRIRPESIMTRTRNYKPGMSLWILKTFAAVYEFAKKHDLLDRDRRYLAKNFFINLGFAFEWEKTENGRKDIYKFALDFIEQENLTGQGFFADFRPYLRKLKNRTYCGEKRGIIRRIFG
ncbi:MAG: glycosyltransferase [Alphaproteobacteria bacterium]|nr:glycosyltransferase [Alphaproteobacteria bacterium]